ncbi:MAG: Paraquat-inducible protein B [Syntrophus sp. PtaU1.Bin208]|nr:MAG: Paraquat-inducible protein B [Syntrophus sp. PtaU1.Bin208]
MSGKANKTLIGAFVVGALAILIGTVLTLGSGKFFRESKYYVLFFEGSVKGLNVGSPVTFRGVKIGEVTDISVAIDQKNRALHIPVIIRLEPARIQGAERIRIDAKAIEKAVSMGLRGQLQLQNYVTGQLMVALDFFPSKPAHYVGTNEAYAEIPTIPTEFQELQRSIANLPLREIMANLNSAVEGLDKLIRSIDAKQTAQSLESTIHDVQTLVQHVDSRIDPLFESLARTSSATEATLTEGKATAAALREEVRELVASTKTTLESAQAMMKQSELTLQTYSEDSPLVVEMNRTLRELGAASRSLRQLSDYLERHPDSLLKGKAIPKGY